MRAAALLAVAALSGCGETPTPPAPQKPAVACAGVDQRLDAEAARLATRNIGATTGVDPALIKVDRLMRQGRWTLAWSTPPGMERGVFFLRRNGPVDETIDTWGGVAGRDEREQTADWAATRAKGRPDPMSRSLALCFADAIASEV